MREMGLYRGRRHDNNEWIYGSLLGKDVIVVGEPDVDENYIGLDEWCSVDPSSVGEYTGVHDDVNDEKIFSNSNIETDYEGKRVRVTVAQECGAFILCSDELPDGFIWMHYKTENDRDYCWIPNSKVIHDAEAHP